MPNIQHLSHDELAREWHQRPGLIPVHCAADRPLMVWCDVGDRHFTKPFFADFLMEVNDHPDRFALFATDLEALRAVEPSREDVLPLRFLFHSGRCGSTLLARALTRWPACVVLSEPPPLNDVWWQWTDAWRNPGGINADRMEMFRRLVSLMARRRADGQEACLVKFSSWTTALAGTLLDAFPQTPALYLYRDPLEVMVSLEQSAPGWLGGKESAFGAFIAGGESASMGDLEFMASVLAHGMETALAAPGARMGLVNYADLKRDRFRDILHSGLELEPGDDALDAMLGQFGHHAKDAKGKRAFRDDRAAKQQAASQDIRELVKRRLAPLYERLESRATLTSTGAA